jgi:hypothetical protein
MPEPVYNALKMLRRETWGPDLQSAYDRDDLEIEKYSTAIAVERQEGIAEGLMKGLIGAFLDAGNLGKRSLREIRQNPLDEDWIRTVWNIREMEMKEFESGGEGEEEDTLEGQTLNDFITYLRSQKAILENEENEN